MCSVLTVHRRSTPQVAGRTIPGKSAVQAVPPYSEHFSLVHMCACDSRLCNSTLTTSAFCGGARMPNRSCAFAVDAAKILGRISFFLALPAAELRNLSILKNGRTTR